MSKRIVLKFSWSGDLDLKNAPNILESNTINECGLKVDT